MKATGIHNSLKDLSEEIGHCERHLSRVMKLKEPQLALRKNQSLSSTAVDRSVIRQQTEKAPSFSCRPTKTGKCSKSYESPSRSRSKHDCDKSILCKETIKDRRGATQVQVVVQTKPLRRRSRSALSSKSGTPLTRDGSVCHENIGLPTSSGSLKKNPSWSHILQQQNNVSSAHILDRCDGSHNSQLENWIRAVPQSSNVTKKLCKGSASGHLRSSERLGEQAAVFDPMRTLTFLVKELRGKVHKNCDDNMLRIVEDMEKALHCMPSEKRQSVSNTQATVTKGTESQSFVNGNTPARPRSSLSDSFGRCSTKMLLKKPKHQVEADSVGAKCLVGILNATVARVKDIARSSSLKVAEEVSHKGDSCNRPPPNLSTQSSLLFELETNCKQLEETCRQMQEQCETLRHERQQALEEVQRKTAQLEAALGKNRQLTMYSADVRQEMLRVQQAAEVVQQEHNTLKNQLLKMQHESQDSSGLLSKRLEEALHENERLSTELHLCQLERDKLQILLSSKDLEVTKLKKEIVGISALVSEQLASLYAISRQNKNISKLDEMMRNIGKFCENNDTINHTLVNSDLHESFLKHAGEGEGNRTQPVCSSPTSSINSSLYNSWHLSDISGIADTFKKPVSGNHQEGGDVSMRTSDSIAEKDGSPILETPLKRKSIKNSTKDVNEALKVDSASNPNNKKDPAELKAELQDVFQLLKKQAAEAVNVTLPSPLQKCMEVSDSVEISDWTELSASLLHSSEDSHSD